MIILVKLNAIDIWNKLGLSFAHVKGLLVWYIGHCKNWTVIIVKMMMNEILSVTLFLVQILLKDTDTIHKSDKRGKSWKENDFLMNDENLFPFVNYST